MMMRSYIARCKSARALTDFRRPAFDVHHMPKSGKNGYRFSVTYLEKGSILVTYYPRDSSATEFSRPSFDMTRRHSVYLDIKSVATILAVADGRLTSASMQARCGNHVEYYRRDPTQNSDLSSGLEEKDDRETEDFTSDAPLFYLRVKQCIPVNLLKPPVVDNPDKQVAHDSTSKGKSEHNQGLQTEEKIETMPKPAWELAPLQFEISFTSHTCIMWHRFLNSVVKHFMGFIEVFL